MAGNSVGGDNVQHEHDDEHDTSSSYLTVDTAVSAAEAAELDAIALLDNTGDVHLLADPEVSAPLVQTEREDGMPCLWPPLTPAVKTKTMYNTTRDIGQKSANARCLHGFM